MFVMTVCLGSLVSKQLVMSAGLASIVLLTGCPKGDASATDAAAVSTSTSASTGTGTAASSGAAAGQVHADTKSFTGAMRGTLDSKHAIVMHLMHTGSSATAVEGYYYYVPSIENLNVKGTAAADGTVHLDETSNGKPSGAFDGHLNGQDSLDGTWTDPKKTKSLPFHLDLVRVADNAPAVIVERKEVSKHKPTAKYDKTQWSGDQVCDVNVTFPDILGAITPASAEIKVDHDLREMAIGQSSEKGATTVLTCEQPSTLNASYNIHANGSGVLSVVQPGGFMNFGMPGPSYGQGFTSLSIPAGKPFELKDILTPAGVALVNARVLAVLSKGIDPKDPQVQAVKDAIASGVSFAVTANGLSASVFDGLPKAYQGIADAEIPVSVKDLEATRVHPSPVDALWGK